MVLVSKTDQRVSDNLAYSSKIHGFEVKKNANKTISVLLVQSSKVSLVACSIEQAGKKEAGEKSRCHEICCLNDKGWMDIWLEDIAAIWIYTTTNLKLSVAKFLWEMEKMRSQNTQDFEKKP